MRRLFLGGGILVLVLVVGVLWWSSASDRETGAAPPPAAPANTDPVQHGRDLVALGDCRPCHTARGGAPFAGGRAIPTPFGTFYSPNITADARTGLGSWTATDFWHALHNGYSKDGTLLYPTFPYTNYTKISRADADAMFAYLRSITPVTQVNRPHELAFPYNHRVLLVGWRALFFRPGVYAAESGQSPEWNRGAYLVQGVAHCSACHEARNALGATRAKAGPVGGLVLSWYAPSLTSPHEAGVQGWSDADIVTLLKTGRVASDAVKAATLGPMAEVVSEGLQQAPDDELRAMATYLKTLPVTDPADAGRGPGEIPKPVLVAGETLYEKNCADCHGKQGEGQEPAAPPLAGSRAVTMNSPVNAIRMVLFGGYSPGTAGNPRPFGMPPYSLTLTDEEIAEVLIYVRSSWGNNSRPVRGEEVAANRGSPLW